MSRSASLFPSIPPSDAGGILAQWSPACYASRVSTDTKWIIGTVVGSGLAIVTAVLTVAGLLLAQFGGLNDRIDDVNARIDGLDGSVNARIDDLDGSVNARIDDLRADLRDFRSEVQARMDGFDTRLRNVEVAFGKVDQRLLTIERVVLPTPEPPAD